jgi:hypothetical protein
MNKLRHNTGLVFASWALLLMFGCHKKKPNIPPEGTPPTIISELPTIPTEPPAQQNPSPTQEPQATNKPQETPHPPPRRPRPHAPAPKKTVVEPEKPAPTEEAKNIPLPKVVIQEGGVNGNTGQVPNGAARDNSGSTDSSTQQLLESTENNLRTIAKRKLSQDEESTKTQILDYVKQSRDATKDGDNVRAHSLALKARLLSDELVKTQ